MEAIFIYLVKSILISIVFWGYYKLFLEGKEFHHYNRFYLMIAVVLSIVLPMVRVDWFTIQPNNEHLTTLLHYINGNAFTESTEKDESSWMFYLGIIIAGISALFLGKVIFGIYRLMLLKSKYPKEKHEHYTMVLTDLPSAPFTFLKNLFWNNSIDINTTSGEKILLHELAHIEEKHTVDRLFLQVVKAIFWFNPILYLFHNEVILIHEYLADQKAIKNKDSSAFAAMLLSQHYSKTAISGTSPFFNSTIKKRLAMLKKNHNTKFSYARRALALPVLFTMSLVYMVQAKNKEIEISNNAVDTFVKDQVKQAQDTIKEKEIIRVESTFTESKDDRVENENFSLRYNAKNGFKSKIDENVEIYLDGKKITQEEMNALEPGSIKDIKFKNGETKVIHIESNESDSKASNEDKKVAIATFVEEDQPVSKEKNTYYINNKEITEEELKEKFPSIHKTIKSKNQEDIASSPMVISINYEEVAEEEIKENYPEVYQNTKNKSGKYIAVSPKVLTIEDKDGNAIKLNSNGKNTLGDEKLAIYLDGKKITEKELFKINPDYIEEMKVDKNNKRIDVTLK